MLGTAYFLIKNSIVTVVVVTLMQVSVLGKTIEDRIMNFVRGNFAVKFLGTEHITLNEESLELTPEQLKKIKARFGESKFMKMIKEQAKELIKEEMGSLQANPAQIEKELKKLESGSRQQRRQPAKK